jgi:hypothetical protein
VAETRVFATPTRERVFTLGLLCAVIATLYLVDWSSRKPFLRNLHTMRPGMPESEVKQIMARYMQGTGWLVPPDASSNLAATLVGSGPGSQCVTGTSPSGELTLHDSLVFRHSNDGAFNSD